MVLSPQTQAGIDSLFEENNLFLATMDLDPVPVEALDCWAVDPQLLDIGTSPDSSIAPSDKLPRSGPSDDILVSPKTIDYLPVSGSISTTDPTVTFNPSTSNMSVPHFDADFNFPPILNNVDVGLHSEQFPPSVRPWGSIPSSKAAYLPVVPQIHSNMTVFQPPSISLFTPQTIPTAQLPLFVGQDVTVPSTFDPFLDFSQDFTYPDPLAAFNTNPYPNTLNLSPNPSKSVPPRSVIPQQVPSVSTTGPSRKRRRYTRRRRAAAALESDNTDSESAEEDHRVERKRPKTAYDRPVVGQHKLPQSVPGKSWIKPNYNSRGMNSRSANINDFDPSAYYEPLTEIPVSWGGHGKRRLFRYNAFGELVPTNRYTKSQVIEYLRDHPLHAKSGHASNPEMLVSQGVDSAYISQYDGRRSPLTLWIQTTPADSGRRYPERGSDKCRFQDCPIKHGTILKGQFRVCFDEQTDSSQVLDPFHNAGYVHLYCLEKFCDFPSICRLFNVRPDTRELREGRNRMAITRDHPEFERLVRRFARKCVPRQEGEPYVHENSLTYKLTIRHCQLQPVKRQTTRANRAGNSLDIHKGNLDKFVQGQERKRKNRRSQSKTAFQELEEDVLNNNDCSDDGSSKVTLARESHTQQVQKEGESEDEGDDEEWLASIMAW